MRAAGLPYARENVTSLVAITGTIGPRLTMNRADPNSLEWGVTVQYSLPYLQNFVHDVGLKAPFSNLVPGRRVPDEHLYRRPLFGAYHREHQFRRDLAQPVGATGRVKR
jgi:hypothetical protein